MPAKNITYHTPINQEENTPLVTILETKIDTKQATAIDSRKAAYVVDLAKSAFGATHYPIPGSQWYLKKISGVWTLMARAARQNPQLDPAIEPVAGETYLGSEVATYIVSPNTVINGDLEVTGTLTSGGMAEVDTEVGTIKLHPTNTPPTGWLICDGSAVSRTTYADLFAVISTTYGVGDGSTTFNIPDLKGKVAVGRDSGQTEFDTIGETGGAKTHTLITAEIPSHLHAVGTLVNGNQSADHSHNQGTLVNNSLGNHTHTIEVDFDGGSGSTRYTVHRGGGAGTHDSDASTSTGAHAHTITGSTGTQSASHNHTITGDTANTGSGSSHNNLQPYAVMNFIIKALSSFAPPSVGDGLTEIAFHAVGTSSTDEGFTAKVVDDTFERFIIRDSGAIEWGSGALSQDVNLYRSAADNLKTDDEFEAVTGFTTAGAVKVHRSAAGDDAFRVNYDTDTTGYRLVINSDGKVEWGAGGTSAVDTNLYRTAANSLKTDDDFTSAGDIYVDNEAAVAKKVSRGRLMVSVQDAPTADTTTSSSYAAIAGVNTVSFTKDHTETAVEMVFAGTCFTTVAGTVVEFALQVNSVDYLVAHLYFNPTATHLPVSGVSIIGYGVLAAGTYTVTPRWKRLSGTGTMTVDTNDMFMFTLKEIG